MSELEMHLDDNHLHIVAAPGSGKTVLGLEVARRLNRPTLILAPTIAIRDQWGDRLTEMFCDGNRPPWISCDVRSPAFLTVTTYQGLFSAMTEREGDNKEACQRVLDSLTAMGIETLVLDEAHHLRQAWWQCLVRVKEHLEEPTVVALTATPPFDVTPQEWDRYVDLCGSIDTEITVPELVRQNNLCPHQDLIFLSQPLQSEREEIHRYRAAVDSYLSALLPDEELVQSLAQHPHVAQPKNHLNAILDVPSFYTAIAVFLKQATGTLPKRLSRVIGLSRRHCPKLTKPLWEELLAGFLYTQRKTFLLPEPLIARLQKDLVRLGAADKRRMELVDPKKVVGRLITSASKLASITAIVSLEQQKLGEGLRLVILTDYIRREALPHDPEDLQPIQHLGVVPIFEQLRRERIAGQHLGILSGSLVVIPQQALELLHAIAQEMDLDVTRIACKPLACDPTYCEISVRGADAHRITHLVTQLFNRGGVTTLVGTASLLGEGWDAPSVNTLVLASFVGSFMLSNQMRGRAIRTQSGHPDKTANIWHLVCQEPDRDQVGPDLALMQRRFEAFSGVSFTQDVISNGVDRLGLGTPPFTQRRIDKINADMKAYARDRNELRERWHRALDKADEGTMVELLMTSPMILPRRFIFANTIMAILWQAWFWFCFYVVNTFQGVEGHLADMGGRALVLLVLSTCVIASVVALPWCLRALWLFLRHAPVASSVRQIGKAVLQALILADVVETAPRNLKVVTQKMAEGAVSCTLKGGTSRERTVFLDALQELLGPIENPRYLLVRHTPLLRWIRKDYHVVPKALGRNKEQAQTFKTLWTHYVGSAELIYTRNEEGRQLLLHARTHALSTAFVPRSDRLRTWQ